MKTTISIIAIVCALGLGFSPFISVTPAQNKQETKALDVGKLWGQNCATCHGKDGRSKTIKGRLKGARDLTDPVWQDAVTDQRISDSIKIGKDGGMPAFGKKLSDDEIETLAGYVRLFRKK